VEDQRVQVGCAVLKKKNGIGFQETQGRKRWEKFAVSIGQRGDESERLMKKNVGEKTATTCSSKPGTGSSLKPRDAHERGPKNNIPGNLKPRTTTDEEIKGGEKKEVSSGPTRPGASPAGGERNKVFPGGTKGRRGHG